MRLFLEYEKSKKNLRDLKVYQIELLGKVIKEKKPKTKEWLLVLSEVVDRLIERREADRHEIELELKNSFRHGRDVLDSIYYYYYIDNRTVTNISLMTNYSERQVYRKLDEIKEIIKEMEDHINGNKDS